MKVTREIQDYSTPPPKKPNIRVHDSWLRGTLVEIEVEGSRYTVDGNEIKHAVDNCMNM